MKIYEEISKLIGNTPLLKLRKMAEGIDATVLGKLEYMNPSSSVKDRIAANMIDVAEKEGKLKPGGLIVEPTSGNTGVGIAMVGASRGYRMIFTMPETMSVERRLILEHFGAEIVLTPGPLGMTGAVEEAKKIVGETPGAFMPQQFENPSNPAIHEKTTGPEIWNDTDGTVDIFVAGVGTGGTITGTGRFLKSKKPSLKVVAVEPAASAVLSGGKASPHAIQGIGAGFVPKTLDMSVLDEIFKVADEDALATARLLSVKEGVLCGISSGAAVYAALEIAKRPENKGKTIVTIICDTGERYLSTNLFS